jgi:hypothetical protein
MLEEWVMFWLRALSYVIDTSFCDANKRYGAWGIFIDGDASDEYDKFKTREK